MPTTAVKRKWFYPLQDQLEKHIQAKYDQWSCAWQEVGKSIVIECYMVRERGEGQIMKAVIFVMYKAHNSVTYFEGGNRIN
jgi:hypothetical protein